MVNNYTKAELAAQILIKPVDSTGFKELNNALKRALLGIKGQNFNMKNVFMKTITLDVQRKGRDIFSINEQDFFLFEKAFKIREDGTDTEIIDRAKDFLKKTTLIEDTKPYTGFYQKSFVDLRYEDFLASGPPTINDGVFFTWLEQALKSFCATPQPEDCIKILHDLFQEIGKFEQDFEKFIIDYD